MSVAKEERGDPHLSITEVVSAFKNNVLSNVVTSLQIGGGLEVRTLTFKQLQKVVGCAGDKKLTEVRLCLEGMSQHQDT